MSAGMIVRFIRSVNVAGNQISINVASEIRHAGIRRSIDAISPTLLDDTVNRVEMALMSSTLLSADQASITTSIPITSMPHESPAYPQEHSTIVASDAHGRRVATGHVTTNTDQQQRVDSAEQLGGLRYS
ncbi:hypothetical protein BKA66DRAFT_566722 [Pyrenochaeta sp. MPI-SDFR-AT-0127]|nr:hypothetical protein BKA66DRAFT_566722 [Pyrenochaeta sp. MPI-SDFR-AT-0127]